LRTAVAARKQPADIAGSTSLMTSAKDAGEDIAMRRRRLRYRAGHRGTRELDLILGPFAEARADAMDGVELSAFERLLAEEETDLQDWLLGLAPAPAAHLSLIDTLLAFRAETLSR
jgi:antitoxin CptB